MWISCYPVVYWDQYVIHGVDSTLVSDHNTCECESAVIQSHDDDSSMVQYDVY